MPLSGPPSANASDPVLDVSFLTSNTAYSRRPELTSRQLKTKVEDAKKEAKAEDKASIENIMFWMAYVGSLGKQTHPIPSSSGWFSVELERVTEEIELRISEDQQNVVEHFLFSSCLEEETRSGRACRTEELRRGVCEARRMS